MACIRSAIWITFLLTAACGPPEPPELVLWAWERLEDLRFLAPGDAKVAVLISRIVLDGTTLTPYPRAAPLQLDGFTEVLPVVRIETRRPALDGEQLEALLRSIRSVTRDSRFRGLQIDFDARVSERAFYRRLLDTLRNGYGEQYRPLSITALASWCGSKSWLADLPVDEIVPMVF